jgi:hypothetical protein
MQYRSKTETRWSLLLCLCVLGLVTAFTILASQFRSEAGGQKGLIQRTVSQDTGLPNYDIRNAGSKKSGLAVDKFRQDSGKEASAVADIRDEFVRGENELRTRVPSLKIEYNEDIRIPEVITPDVWKTRMEYLTAPSGTKRSDILRDFVKENASLIGVNNQQADSLKVTQDYTNPDGNMSFAMLEQTIKGVPVFRGEVKAGFTKSGQMIRVINNLSPGLDYDSLSTNFYNPADAVRAAARTINHELKSTDTARNEAESTDLKTVFGRGDWATTAEKMYFATEPGVARTAWRVLIWEPVNAYYVIVDAETGAMLWRKNITEDQTQSATYNVYRNVNAYVDVADSPAPLSPGPLDPTTGTQGTIIPRADMTLIGNEGALSFNNNGWITDGANITDGNSNESGIDRDGTNGVDAPQTGSPNRVFTTAAPAWNPPPGAPAPGDAPLDPQAQRGAVIQMFYAMNRYHDKLYQIGFTEAAFNFQADNFGRGGAGADRVSAEGQDSIGTNNANFSTPADGGRGRMQMFLWTGPTPDYDGTADAEVIYHEVTHGTSNRLHGNAAGLSTNMARGMGEGWSDWYAEVMLAEAPPVDPINSIHTTGGYATFLIAAGFTGNYYYGIRRFPRAPITFLGANGKPHNPYTFRYVNSDCNTLIGTTTSNPPPNSAFPRGPIGVAQCDQVHNLGEIWSSALWEVRDRMVTRLGFTAGTTRVLQVVTDGMKLAPVGPTFLQERDAIIAAAAALPLAPEAAADVFDVREGFRVRGMGFSASIQSASPAAVTEAFDVPNAIITNPITVSDSTGDNDGFPEPGELLSVSVPITNNSGSGTINTVVGSVTGGGSADYGNIADGATVTRQISYTVPGGAVCGSMHDITITGTSSLGALNPQTFSFRLGAPVGGAPATFTSSTALTIPDVGVSVPYGTTVVASGLSGNKLLKLEITGLTHTFPGDLDYLLVGPGGQKFSLLSDSGSTGDVSNLTLTLSDAAAAQPSTSQWVAGNFKPVNITTGDTFPAPAPVGPYVEAPTAGAGTFASVFGTDGSTMNGTWTLYLVDDAAGDLGTQTGWKLTFEANDYVCSLVTNVKSRADFDNDGKTDLSVFRPSEGNWYLNQSTAGFGVINWGLSADVLTPGDYDGDGKTDTAIFRANADSSQPDFYILNSNGFTLSGVSWGLAGDIPVNRDYDGDFKTDIGVFRPSSNTWYILKSGGGITVTPFGQAGDVPVAGDFDGDGKGDLAVYRSGTWLGQLSAGGTFSTALGTAGDILVPADYDNDNKDDLAVFRPSNGNWIHIRSNGGATITTPWGASGDVPVPGDYDGDGQDDQAIYRNGQWWLLRSTSGTSVQNFGLSTDKAIPKSYVP